MPIRLRLGLVKQNNQMSFALELRSEKPGSLRSYQLCCETSRQAPIQASSSLRSKRRVFRPILCLPITPSFANCRIWATVNPQYSAAALVLSHLVVWVVISNLLVLFVSILHNSDILSSPFCDDLKIPPHPPIVTGKQIGRAHV